MFACSKVVLRALHQQVAKNQQLVAPSGVEAPNPERVTGFDFAHSDDESALLVAVSVHDPLCVRRAHDAVRRPVCPSP